MVTTTFQGGYNATVNNLYVIHIKIVVPMKTKTIYMKELTAHFFETLVGLLSDIHPQLKEMVQYKITLVMGR